MGITYNVAVQLAEDAERFCLGGEILTLGKQDVLFKRDKLIKVLMETGHASLNDDNTIKLKICRPLLFTEELEKNQGLSSNPVFKQRGCISDRLFFGSLGLDVKSLDVSRYEGADYIYDLNDVNTPDSFKNRFDVIFDGGTIEHVFNVANTMSNIFAMLKTDGVVIHSTPSNNYVEHGFYQFSPTFFYDYYSTNNFDILECLFTSHDGNLNERWMSTKYYPGCFEGKLWTGCTGNNEYYSKGLDDKFYSTWFVARKTSKSTGNKAPMQGLYMKTNNWRGEQDVLLH